MIRMEEAIRKPRAKLTTTQHLCVTVIVISVCFVLVQLLWLRLTPSFCYGIHSAEDLGAGRREVCHCSRKIYVITATYPRSEQLAELTRLGQTLKLVHNVVWLLVEDATTKTPAVEKLLKRLGVPYVHLTAPTPKKFLNLVAKDCVPKGVFGRNLALEWLRENAILGVLYFADADNSYDVRLFEEMRNTERVSMWPAGLVGGLGVSSPIVREGEVVGFYNCGNSSRKFPVVLAQFAVGVEFLLERPNAMIPLSFKYQEDGFLRSLDPFEPDEIEVKASNCTELLVWHTHTVDSPLPQPLNMTRYSGTNLVQLFENL